MVVPLHQFTIFVSDLNEWMKNSLNEIWNTLAVPLKDSIWSEEKIHHE